MNKAEHSKCLLLNADYTPLRVISWQKAIIWSIRYQNNSNYSIEIIEYYKDKYIQGTNDKKYPVPLVAKTLKYFNIYNRSIKFSRKNLFIRDNYTCQYCGKNLSSTELTYDHVIPKSKFVPNAQYATTWSNITTACIMCNRKKSNKTPEQAHMRLLSVPKQPSYETKYLPVATELISMISMEDSNQKEWMKYINGNF